MKNKTVRLALISIIICALLGTNVSADVTIIQAEIDGKTDSLILKGKVSEPMKTDRVTVEILNPLMGISDIENLTPETLGDVFDNITELKTDGDGVFSEKMKIKGLSGFYGIRVKENNAEDAAFFENCFFYYSKAQAEDILRLINGASSYETLEKVLDNNIHSLYVNAEMYKKLSKEEKLELCRFIIKSKDNGFSSVEDACECISYALLSDALKKCVSENEAEAVFYDNSEFIGFNEKSPLYMPFYEIMSESGRKETVGMLAAKAPFESRQDFRESFCSSIILRGIKLCSNHLQVGEILISNADFIGKGINAYLDYTDKASVNKSLVGKSFDSTESLLSAIDYAMNKKESGKKSAGGGGSGGSATVTNTKTQPQQSPDPENSEPFSDIVDYPWARESINSLYKKGIISGKGSTFFHPADNVTREETVKMIVSAFFGIEEGCKADFTDVPESVWSYPYVAIAVKKGIANGKGGGYFGAAENITREDMALMLFRCIKNRTPISTGAAPADIGAVSEYAREAVEYMYANGIIKGYGDGSFAPKAYTTRAEAAVLIARIGEITE